MRLFSRACGRAAEAKGRPGEASSKAPASAACLRDLFLLGRGGRACPAVVRSCSIVVAAPRRVAQGIVCIVDLLEAFCAGGALGGVGGDAVGVVFERGFFVGVADLLGGCFGIDFEDFVVVCSCWRGELVWLPWGQV